MNRESKGDDDKSLRILGVARTLFAKDGLRSTSIEDIASAAGLGKGTIYLYFKSKEEIFTTLANAFVEDLHFALGDALSTPATATERLLAYVETRVRFWDRSFREYGLTVKSLLESMTHAPSEQLRKQYVDNDFSLIKDLLDEGMSRGEFSFENSAHTALVFYSMLDALTLPWNQADTEIGVEAKIKAFSSLLMGGLKER